MPSKKDQVECLLEIAKKTVNADSSKGLYFAEISGYSPIKIIEQKELSKGQRNNIAWICTDDRGERGKNNFGFHVPPQYRQNLLDRINAELPDSIGFAEADADYDDKIKIVIGPDGELTHFFEKYEHIVRSSIKMGIERNIIGGKRNRSEFFLEYRNWNGTSLKTILNDEFQVLEEKVRQENVDLEKFLAKTGLEGREREIIAKARIGQGNFRKLLLSYWGAKCSVTGCGLIEGLIASHIEPWSQCDSNRKVDIYNGLLLTPNLDKLFDRHLISFNEQGKIMISEALTSENRRYLGLSDGMKLRELEEKHQQYLKIHRQQFTEKEKQQDGA